LPIRLVAVDLDGTLIDHQLRMNPRDRDALRAAVASGIHVVIATGRMFRSSLPYAQELGLTGPIINYQGAVVREIASGQVIYRCELSLPMLRRALEYAEPRGWHVNAYVDEEVYTERASPEADLYARISIVPYHVVGPLSQWLKGESTKLVLVVLDPAEVPARMAELDAWMAGVARVTRSLDWFIEVVNPQVSKARALALVAERLGVDRSEVCAIGDNVNDQEMIEWAGLGAVMRTAPAGLRQRAAFTTTTPEEGGVAEVLNRFVLGQQLPPRPASGSPAPA
jgi:Cof subfamily protein (haloacid dehalogenase superfamily)